MPSIQIRIFLLIDFREFTIILRRQLDGRFVMLLDVSSLLGLGVELTK
jgi:hypothetical protein